MEYKHLGVKGKVDAKQKLVKYFFCPFCLLSARSCEFIISVKFISSSVDRTNNSYHL